METIKIARYQSPIGEMIIGSHAGRLCLCDWANGRRRLTIDNRLMRNLKSTFEEGITDIISEAIGQLDEYFEGRRREFSIPIVYSGTDFQCRVWAELMAIPYGTTISYSQLARRIDNPKAVRAAAAANATNPISIFVPCHRVIGSDNRLTGYGGGLEIKQTLLELEAQVNGQMLPLRFNRS